MIESKCVLCSQPYQIDDSVSGQQIQCPSCGQIIIAGPPATPTRSKLAPSLAQPKPVAPSGPGVVQAGVVWAGQGQRQMYKPGYENILPYVFGAVAALVCTLLIYGLLVFISLKFKPLAGWIITYLPIIPGALVGITIFTNEGQKNSPSTIPTLPMSLGVGLAILLSTGPALIMNAIDNSSLKKQIVLTISEETAPPNFIIGGQAVSLMAVNVGKAASGGVCQVEAVYSNNKIFNLTVIRNVSKIVDLSGIPEMKSAMIMENHIENLTASLRKYSALKTTKVTAFSLLQMTRPGNYQAKATLSGGFDVEMIVQIANQSMKFALTPESARAVRAVPEVTKVWKKFDATGKTVCTKVVLNKEVDATHWEATATLSNDKTMPIFIQETVTNNIADIHVFFPAKETAILQINNIIKNTGTFADRKISEQCVNLKTINDIRSDEQNMEILFVEESPANAVISKFGFDVRVLPGRWQVLCGNEQNRKELGWSVLIPTDYQVSSDSKDRSLRTAKHKDSKILKSLSMNAKDFSDISKFSLSDYVAKERTDWMTKHPGAIAGDIISFVTYSGLKGFSYTASAGVAFRAKYFFIKQNSLAILSFDDLSANSESSTIADQFAKTMRYNDKSDESLASK